MNSGIMGRGFIWCVSVSCCKIGGPDMFCFMLSVATDV